MALKIAVMHHSLNIPGGAERLCLAVVEALRRKGHEVTLITVEETDWSLVQRNFGNVIMPNNEDYLTGFQLSKFLSNIPFVSLYFIACILQLLLSKSKRQYDLLINTFGDAFNSVADVTYIHFPLRAAVDFSQIPAFTSKQVWSAAAPIYNMAMSFLDRVSPGELLTNSKFTQEIIKKVLHRKSLVVYPPVDVKTFSSRCFKSRKNGRIVATISSYTPKRHLEQIPLIAKHTKSAKFVVMGKAGEYSSSTLRKLQLLVKSLHVEDRVKLLTNVPIDRFLEILSSAKLYVHVMPYDHFGISVVEAMASGCVPVVHRSGGPWLDILDGRQGDYGFSYVTAEEAASFINALITNENLRSKMASRDLNRAKKFDRSIFMEEVVKVVEKIAC